jgi:predicted RNA-binding Zn ribbon-like protein
MLPSSAQTCQIGYVTTKPKPEDRDGFRFRGGCNPIDLPATLQGRLSTSPRELLGTPSDLGRWLVSVGLASAAPDVTGQDLATARALREAIYALVGRRGAAESRTARKILNGIAARPAAVPQLSSDDTVTLTGSAGALIATLARDAVQLFGSDAAKLIRQCESPTCTLYFLDTSRRGDRRWCSMLACGNRAKAAAFRRRNRRLQSDS